jgi:DNA-binding IclR family transcriptional regulator
MSVTRLTVLERLAAASDAERRETTTVASLAAAVGADRATVEAHLDGLVACDLARTDGKRARVTVTGEELVELGVDEVAIVDAATPESER